MVTLGDISRHPLIQRVESYGSTIVIGVKGDVDLLGVLQDHAFRYTRSDDRLYSFEVPIKRLVDLVMVLDAIVVARKIDGTWREKEHPTLRRTVKL